MTKEEILEKTSMRDVLSRYGIKVSRGMCSCPFHGADKHPSMKVYETSCHCFACSETWDLFSFVMQMDGLSFKEAFLSLGGTYEHVDNKIDRYTISQKRELQKKAREREAAEKVRQYKEVCTALEMCRKMVKITEPLSDEWCFWINRLEYITYIFDALYIEETEVYDTYVYRKCKDTLTRGLQRTGAV